MNLDTNLTSFIAYSLPFSHSESSSSSLMHSDVYEIFFRKLSSKCTCANHIKAYKIF